MKMSRSAFAKTITRLNPIETVWDELDRVKEKQPTSNQHMWELLQKSIPGESG
jgi:transposase